MKFSSLGILPRAARVGTTACLTSFTMCLAGNAFAYSPAWLACTGDITLTSGTTASKQATNDTYVYDADAKNLFQYSEPRKALSYIGHSPNADGKVSWSGSGGEDNGRWNGQFDNNAMSLRIERVGDNATRVWSLRCKPTSPREEAS